MAFFLVTFASLIQAKEREKESVIEWINQQKKISWGCADANDDKKKEREREKFSEWIF